MVLAAVLNIGASVMNGGAGTGSVDFFHGFQVAIMMTIMFNLTQFIYWRCNQTRRGSCWEKHRPTFLMLISAIMTNVQPMAILACGSFKLICCPCTMVGAEDDTCTPTGRSMPPWTDAKGNPEWRTCHGNGNWFWAEDHCTGQELALFPNKASGWVIQIFLTWGGFVVMFLAVMEAMQLGKKIKNKWRTLRSGR